MKVECLRFSGQRLVICEYREWPTIEKDMRFLFAKSKARFLFLNDGNGMKNEKIESLTASELDQV